MLYVISYDVVDDRRRTRVHEVLKGYGRRVQYSVFECDLRPAEVRELESRVRYELDGETDTCRFYRLCEGCRPEVLIVGQGDHYVEPKVIIV